jgi:hypothetical protein
MTFADTTSNAVERLRDEYEAMVGLRLTRTQVARLLDIDEDGATQVLAQLEAEGLLVAASDGVYRRSEPLLA